jgi:AraC family transcriptional regulator, positive regulator of tynA and feaB
MLTHSTDVVPERERFEYWRELISSHLLSVNLDRDARGAFFGKMVSSDIGENRLVYVHSTSQHITRIARRTCQNHEDSFLLKYLIEGRGSTSQHGNFHDLVAGDLFLQDSRSCGELRLTGDFKVLTLSLSRKLVDRYFARPQYLCAVPLSVERSAAGCVARDLLQSIARNCMQMQGDGLETLVESLLQVVALAFGQSPLQCPAATTSHSALMIRIRNYIHAHLEDDEMSPKRIAAAHGISERYLNKLFEKEETTVSKWIWEQRLQASQRTLSLTEFSSRKINEIAYACGFNNMSHFSCSFKKRFGCTPRQYRTRELKAHAQRTPHGRDRPGADYSPATVESDLTL